MAIDKLMFEASLVEEINHFEDPRKWVIFSMAHVYHRFDATFVERLMHWPGLEGHRTRNAIPGSGKRIADPLICAQLRFRR